MRRLCYLLPALLLAVLVLPPAPGHAGKLADDGRAGVVLEVQGTALVRPAGRQRWTPLGAKSVLYPGDLIRTQARGAHALEIALAKGKALLGPGVELQLTADGTPRLLRGEAEVLGTPEVPLPVAAAGGLALDVKGTAWLRARGKQTEQLAAAPRWVQGYRDSASDEWMGSLLAQVDGRDVPLAVGYHKVDVEVRDQIARTTVEQSFVNGTKNRLEGVFYFPLPADASISGFGMWIGGELVEADIVERQRARQIYEDILRRKKDPGLLEWEGGNIFKARVFPIEPFSEKRIRIRYTQVLPLEGDTWRYRYALRSELLRTKPLRELQIAVRVVSTQAMQEVSSPTHEITLHTTGHEATAEFRASEYRPKDDFELAVKVDRAKAITAIPHRRGEDGYFMLMLAPPAAESSAWQRDLAPEGDPLDVILLADTSGSMDEAARTNQARFLEGMLSLLGSKDRFRLAAFDADVRWLTAEASAPSEDSIRAAMDALAARRSLGWTDLDAGVKAALAQAGEDTLVVYVGDGVSTTGDADAAATAQRMRALGKASKAAIHAVAASSSFEQGVLRALAETGGGSMRALGANPTADAYALLAEAARPSVKDLRVEIEGLRTARVYPSRLPNLPLGSQQVVLGRFLPADTAQDGRVVVHGTLAGKPVRYAADVRIPAADVGNSFLPRLWGRSHINALLEQGGPEINEEIVAFSERFGIMTPLTSFLVLESDEDRKRYGVARRVRMRDGERFFADAKDRAMLEQKRDLMKQAGRWRAGLRGDALRDIARLGRDLPVQFPTQPDSLEVAYAETTTASGFGFTSFGQTAFADKDGDTFFTDRNAAADVGLSIRELQDTTRDARRYAGPMDGGAGDPAGVDSWGDGFDGEASEGGLQGGPVTGATRMRHSLGRGGGGSPAPAATMPPSGPAKKPFAKRGNPRAGRAPAREALESKADRPPGELDDLLEEVNEGRARIAQSPTSPAMRRSSFSRAGRLQDGYARAPQPGPPSYAFTLQTLGFPAVPGAPRAAEDVSDPAWDAAALALLRTLPRRADVRKLEGGLHLVLRREGLHPTRGAVTGGRGLEAWIGSESWRMTRTSHSFAERDEQWSHAGVRGALAQARRLARTRTARPTDANAWWLPLWDLRARDVIQAWARAGYRAKVVSADATKAVVDLTRRHPDERTIRLSIDPTRRVITETRWIDATGRTVARLAHADFIEVAGRHWAQRLERYDADDRLVERRRLQVEVIERAALDAVLAKAATERTDALTVHGPLPRRADAKQATRERRATFLDHLVLSLSLGQQQRLPESLAAWDAAAALAAGKPGLPWVRTTFLTRARQGERFKAWLMGLTPKVQAAPGQDGRFLAAWLHGYARSTLGPRERGELLDALRTAWVDAPAPHADLRELAWQRDHIAVLDALGEVRQARALRTALAKAWPHRTSLLLLHERDLWQTGQVAPALAALAQALQDREPWTEGERGALYRRLTDRLWARRELVRLHARLGDWIKTQPRTPEAWQRYLASLYLLGKEEVADARVVADLGITLADEDPRWHTGRLAAAIAMALGDGWNFQVPQLHKPFGKPLVDALLYEMRRTSKRSGPGMRIFGDWRFRRTDHWRGVQQTLFADLQADGALASMPRHKLTRYLQLLPWNAGGAPDALWRSVVDALKARWTAAEDVFDRTALEGHIVRLLDARSEREAAIAFLTQALGRARQGQDGESVRLAGILFYRLLSTPDHDAAQTTEREDACFALLPGLLDPKANAETRLGLAASNLRTLADRLYRWRYARALGTPASRAELTRAELKLLRREARAGTRLAMAQRLGTAEKTATAEYKPWLQLERLAYAVEHGADLEAIVAEASAILGRAWTRPDPEGDRRPLERLMRERAAVVLAYAATRRNASDAVSRGVLETFAAGEAAAPAERGTRLLDWREQTWRLLLARDDAAALEANLRRWIVPAQVESRWRVALGYLLAETGRLPPAAEQLEAVRGLDELAPADYAALADWYLVLDDDARRDRATLARYARMNEGQLSSLAYRYENKMRARRGGVPGDFDPEAVRVLRALMRKATYPANYWYRIRNVYRSTKDFRALDPVAFGLLGHTKESIYAFLNQVSRLAGEVHEEATLDEWNAQLTAQSRAADSPLDRRAMQLAIARVEGRASLVPDTDRRSSMSGRPVSASSWPATCSRWARSRTPPCAPSNCDSLRRCARANPKAAWCACASPTPWPRRSGATISTIGPSTSWRQSSRRFARPTRASCRWPHAAASIVTSAGSRTRAASATPSACCCASTSAGTCRCVDGASRVASMSCTSRPCGVEAVSRSVVARPSSRPPRPSSRTP
ncbi:MAG: VIT domain-containing protein [Planctomycetota bacterium]|nr:VIT domain-containing protein [Planctomycetota bacterium]